MILEQSSGGIPFNLVSSSRTTCLTNLIEFCHALTKKKREKIKKSILYSQTHIFFVLVQLVIDYYLYIKKKVIAK